MPPSGGGGFDKRKMARKADTFKIEDQTIFLDQFNYFSAKCTCETLRKFFDCAWRSTIYGTIAQYERLLDYNPLLFDNTDGFVNLELKE